MKKIINSKRKGFTLIELLASILIVGIILSITVYISIDIISNKDKKLTATQEKLLIDSAVAYSNEFSSKINNKAKNDDNLTYCISIQSLIDNGYFTKDKASDQDDMYVLVEYNNITKTITNTSIVDEADCNTQNVELDAGGSSNKKTQISINFNDKNLGNFEYELTKNSSKNNLWDMTIEFKDEFNLSNLLEKYKIYFLYILDNSESMTHNNKFNNAKSAISDFSSELSDSISSLNFGLIQYSKNPTIKQEFSNKLDINNIISPNTSTDLGTNSSGAFDLASSMLSDLDPNAYKYVMFLTDGEPNYYSYYEETSSNSWSKKTTQISSTNNNYFLNYNSKYNSQKILNKNCPGCSGSNACSRCNPYLEASVNHLKNIKNTSLITIGYEFNNEFLKGLSSTNKDLCTTDTNSSGLCYFDSDSSNISSLFDNLQTPIINDIQKKLPSKIELVLNTNDNLIIKDSNGKSVNDITYTLDYDKNFNEYTIDNTEKNYSLSINNEFLKCDNDNACNKALNIIPSAILKYYDNNGNVSSKKIDINSSIDIKIENKNITN